jgi:hypothetical protein
MSSLNEFPEVMAQAHEDLCGNLDGRFSPENWDLILREAHSRWKAKIIGGEDVVMAWQSVIREFHQEQFWGFSPDLQRRSKPLSKQGNLGFSFVWMIFSTFVLAIMAVVWSGQIYTNSNDPKDAYLFFASVAFVLFNFGFFLWRSRHYVD